MLVAPFRWLVRLVSYLPDAIRPGVFLAVCFLLIWAVVRIGPRRLWHGAVRLVGATLEVVAGIVLLVEYQVTKARRRSDQEPASWALAMSGPADQLQAAGAALAQRHAPAEQDPEQDDPEQQDPEPPPRRLPWKTVVVLLVVGTVPWIVMDRAEATSEVTYQLSRAFDRWRDVEAWADVPAERRADPGPALTADGEAPAPTIVATHRRRHGMRVTLRCPSTTVCRGTLRLRARGGRLLGTREVRIAPFARVAMTIGSGGHSVRGARVVVLEA